MYDSTHFWRCLVVVVSGVMSLRKRFPVRCDNDLNYLRYTQHSRVKLNVFIGWLSAVRGGLESTNQPYQWPDTPDTHADQVPGSSSLSNGGGMFRTMGAGMPNYHFRSRQSKRSVYPLPEPMGIAKTLVTRALPRASRKPCRKRR